MRLWQVYAPHAAEESAFHRSLFLFVSAHVRASTLVARVAHTRASQGEVSLETGTVRALRCQLPRSNPYYEFEPPSELSVSQASDARAAGGSTKPVHSYVLQRVCDSWPPTLFNAGHGQTTNLSVRASS